MNPKLSGYAQLHGEFKYNTTPQAPPGTQAIIHKKPTPRGAWTYHGVKGWYLGPSMNHYWCHDVYVTKTRGERDSDCVEFPPHNNPLPYNSSLENVIITAHELANALKNPEHQAPFPNISKSEMVEIDQLTQIFSKVADNVKKRADHQKKNKVKKAAILPQKVHTDRTKPLPSVQ